MSRRRLVLGLSCVLVASTAMWSTGRAEPAPPRGRPVGASTAARSTPPPWRRSSPSASTATRCGSTRSPRHGDRFAVEVILIGRPGRGRRRRRRHAEPTPAASRPPGAGAGRTRVFRPYSGPGGIQEELVTQAAGAPEHRPARGDRQDRQRPGHHRRARHPQRGADPRPASARRRCTSAPSTLGSGSRRRWCGASSTTSSTATAPTRRSPTSSNDNELWFIPVANPDGYDFTFQDGQRLWRKNLRDNDGERHRSPPATVSTSTATSRPAGATTTRARRRTRPATPTAARRRLGAGDAGARLAVRAHHARVLRQLPLGRRAAAARHRLAGRHAVARRRAVRGDGRRRRRPGDPRLRPRHLGRAVHRPTATPTRHMQEAYGTLGFTPEMSTCESASDSDARRPVGARRLRERLRLPRRRGADPGRVREEHPVRPRRRRVGGRP